jgi:hypothetical protein
MIRRAATTTLAALALMSCGRGREPAPIPPPPHPSKLVSESEKGPVDNPEKRAKHMSWEYEIGNSTPETRIAVLTSMADKVDDETDVFFFLNLILNRVPVYEWKLIDLRALVNRWPSNGPTKEAFVEMFENRFRGVRDLSRINNNTHFNLYISRRGFDQDGKPLVAWTIGETWTVVDVSDDFFPVIKVKVNR